MQNLQKMAPSVTPSVTPSVQGLATLLEEFNKTSPHSDLFNYTENDFKALESACHAVQTQQKKLRQLLNIGSVITGTVVIGLAGWLLQSQSQSLGLLITIIWVSVFSVIGLNCSISSTPATSLLAQLAPAKSSVEICKWGLKLIKKSPSALAYRDKVLAQGRELRLWDVQLLSRLAAQDREIKAQITNKVVCQQLHGISLESPREPTVLKDNLCPNTQNQIVS